MADTTIGFDLDGLAERTAAPEYCDSGPESLLVAGLRRGDEAAYEALIRRFDQPVYNLVSRLVDERADASDVVQEVFLKVFRNIASFRRESSLKTWIYRIAVNEARNHRRWFSRHRRPEVNLEARDGEARSLDEMLPAPGRSPYEVTLDHETAVVVEAALADLNPKFRAALVLREIEELSYEEIAEVLEISLGTVKSRILRGRAALKNRLEERLAPQAGLACAVLAD